MSVRYAKHLCSVLNIFFKRGSNKYSNALIENFEFINKLCCTHQVVHDLSAKLYGIKPTKIVLYKKHYNFETIRHFQSKTRYDNLKACFLVLVKFKFCMSWTECATKLQRASGTVIMDIIYMTKK